MKKHITYFLFFSCFFLMKAQTNDRSRKEIDNLVKEYTILFLNSKKIVENITNDTCKPDQKLIHKLLNNNNLNLRKENEKIPELNKFSNIGLKWVSDITHNLTLGISDNEDIYFRSRISTGIDWVILGEGSYFKHKNDYKIDKLQRQRDSIRLIVNNHKDFEQFKLVFIKHLFELHRIDILKQYIKILSEKKEYFKKLHQIKLVNYATKLKVDNQLSKVESELIFKEKYLNDSFTDDTILEYWNLTNIDFELPNINEITVDTYFSNEKEINNLDRELIIRDKRNSDRPSLRTKLRYNYYNSDNNSGRAFTSIGASLSIPIKFEREDVITYKLESLKNTWETKENLLKETLKKEHYEFYSLKNDLKILHNELNYNKALLANEIDIYENHRKQFSPEKYIDYTLQLLDLKLEILNINEQLCEAFIKFHSKTTQKTNTHVNDTSVQKNKKLHSNTLIEGNQDKEIEAEEKVNIQTTKKASYLWSTFFALKSNEELIDILNKNNINRLFISPGLNYEKLNDFINQTQKAKIELHRLIGENSYSKHKDGAQHLIKKLETLHLKGFSGIHLDIEPHTYEDYHENKATYINNMNNIYKKINNWCKSKSLNLSVSIPMHLPEENAKVLAKEKIDVYIMAYENVNQKALLNRTETLRKILKSYVWVLRVNDFKEEKKLNEALLELYKNNVLNIGYYDVSTLKND